MIHYRFAFEVLERLFFGKPHPKAQRERDGDKGDGRRYLRMGLEPPTFYGSKVSTTIDGREE